MKTRVITFDGMGERSDCFYITESQRKINMRKIICLLILFASTTMLYAISVNRVIYFSDGNARDWDDMGATPMAMALFAKSGIGDKLVIVSHSGNIWETSVEREEIQDTITKKAIELFGGTKTFPNVKVFNAFRERNEVIDAVIAEIRKSSANDRLVFISAGPMGIEGESMERYKESLNEGEEDKRKYVSLISHGGWNEYTWSTKFDGTAFGRYWVYTLETIKNRNPMVHVTACITEVTPNADIYMNGQNGTDFNVKKDASKINWMKNHSDPGIAHLYDCILLVYNKKGVYDFSDAGMVFYYTRNDEDAKMTGIKNLLESPTSLR